MERDGHLWTAIVTVQTRRASRRQTWKSDFGERGTSLDKILATFESEG